MNRDSFIMLDTNALIRLLAGDITVKLIIGEKTPCISSITEMEIQCKPNMKATERAIITMLLEDLVIIDINEQIKRLAIKTRLSTSLKLLDAIIIATAQWVNLPLVSEESRFKSASNIDFILLQHHGRKP